MSAARVILSLALAGGSAILALASHAALRPLAASRWRPVAAILCAGFSFLTAFFLLKIPPEVAPPLGLLRDDYLFPLWALWRRSDAWWWFLPALGAFALLAAAWRSGWIARVSSPVFLFGSVLLSTAFWISLALTNGGFPEGLVGPFLRDADYYVNVARFDTWPAVWSGFNRLQPELSLHAGTHPPGPVALLYVLDRASGSRPVAVCLAVVLLGSLTLIPLFAWARLHLDAAGARRACLLWIFTPAVALYGATCMDMVFALVLVVAAWLFLRALALPPPPGRSELLVGIGRGSLAGAVWAAGFLLTYSTALLVAALGLVAANQAFRAPARRARNAALIASSLVSCVAALFAVSWLAGFDWLGSLQTAILLDTAEANAFLSPAYYLLTRLMGVLDFLFLAGVTAAAIWIGVLARGFPQGPSAPSDRLLLESTRAAAAAALFFLLAGIYKIGETGRIWLFLIPFVILAVCRRLDLEPRAREAGARELATAALVTLGLLQSLALELFLDTRW